eukprot:763971-Hanusia_phi.AAC.4
MALDPNSLKAFFRQGQARSSERQPDDKVKRRSMRKLRLWRFKFVCSMKVLYVPEGLKVVLTWFQSGAEDILVVSDLSLILTPSGVMSCHSNAPAIVSCTPSLS